MNINDFGAFPSVATVEFLHHRPPDRLAAHVHGDVAWRIERAIAIAVDLFKDQTQHRGVDDRFGHFLNLGGALAGKVVGVEKFKEIMKSVAGAARPPAGIVLQHRGGMEREFKTMFEIRDLERLLFQVADLEQGAIQVRDVSEFGRNVRCPVMVAAGKDLKEQLLQIIEVSDSCFVQMPSKINHSFVFVTNRCLISWLFSSITCLR